MIKCELLRDKGIAIISPEGELEAGDFTALAGLIDPFIAEKGKLTGLLIDAPSFPGWESFGALVEHIRFVRDHHRKVGRVAAVSDSTFLKVAPRIASHFAQPEIKTFAGHEKAQALAWLAAVGC
jgi:hypothetical protein